MNVLNDTCMNIKIPQDHGRVVYSSGGCLLLILTSGEGLHKLCLLNPVTRAGANLPILPDYTTYILHEFKAAGIIYNVDVQGQADVVI